MGPRSSHDIGRWIASRSAPLMFALSLAFLVCQAVLVVIWVDVPNFRENALIAIDAADPDQAQMRAMLVKPILDHWFRDAAILLSFLIWPVVIAESALHWVTRPWTPENRRWHFVGFLFCLMPSLRMCARSPEMGDRLWLPGLGWRTASKRLRKRLERRFSMPMFAIALMIMPVLVVEFFLKDQVARYVWLRMLLHVSTGVIWFAFAAEFILMVSVAEKKLDYCKRNWIDLAIIVLPLCSFLRSLRVLRAAQFTKMARIYRLRGMAAKAVRALMLLELVQRILGGSEDRWIEKLQRRLADLESEARDVRRRIVRLRRRRRRQEAAASEGSIESRASAPVAGPPER